MNHSKYSIHMNNIIINFCSYGNLNYITFINNTLNTFEFSIPVDLRTIYVLSFLPLKSSFMMIDSIKQLSSLYDKFKTMHNNILINKYF
jgi:hypothetical protein